MSNTTLYSVRVAAGKRTYFLDLAQKEPGSRYLKICESKHCDTDVYERNVVLVFEDHLDAFVNGIHKVLDFLQDGRKPASHMEQLKTKYPNAYKPWTEEEDQQLTILFCTGKSVQEIGNTLQRNKGAITSRIAKLELREKYC